MFSNGKLIHCPWCELPLNWKCLGPPTNLQGQLSKGHKTVATKVPSLAVGENELINLQDYDARKLCDAVTKLHPHGMRLLKKGKVSKVGDQSTATGGSTTAGDATSTAPDTTADDNMSTGTAKMRVKASVENVNDMDDKEVGEQIMANAARIQQKIEDTATCWLNKSPKDRLIAATACPKALYAELELQIKQAKSRGAGPRPISA